MLRTLGATLLLIGVAACASPTPSGDTSTPGGGANGVSSPSGSPTGTSISSSSSLPLGDGRVGLTAQVGSIMLCNVNPNGPGGGAQGNAPWINAVAKTWNPSTKAVVQGAITWPNASLSITVAGDTRTITTNDLPKDEPTGVFPIARNDPAYQFDGNPNHITAQNLTYRVPANPTAASQPTCLHGGPIGVTLDGVALFDPLDAQLRDGVAHEVQDLCGGHPQQQGMYHYHNITSCLSKNATGSSTLVGYALDGFGIYLERGANGQALTNSDLDACHGRVSTVTWDGKQVSMYHYDATDEYPYTLGCFKGTPINTGPPQR